MRILILGKNYPAIQFVKLFSKNKENIVFTDAKGFPFSVEFSSIEDIVEFTKANEINLVVIIDEEYIDSGLGELITSMNITVFAPTSDAILLSSSKISAKKFMYKNKIQTPKFQIAEKPQQALEYVKSNPMPLVFKPDNHNFLETAHFAETQNEAIKTINNLFNNGNKKILIEDYIEGKNLSVWTISDGYSAKIIGTSAKYQNDIAYFEPDFLTDKIRYDIQNNFINPTIEALSNTDEIYVGILGFDFILTYDDEPFLVNYNSFFDDINVDFYTQGFDLKWEEVFESVITGDVFLKYDFKPKSKYMLTLRQDDEINFIITNTKTNLKRYLNDLDYDLEELNEAKSIWRY